MTTLQANNNPNTLNTRNFHPAVLLQNLPRTRRKSPQSYGNKHHLLYLSLILILQSSDCEQNPGPRTLKYPCMICSKAVKWNQREVACDNCEGWYHAECMNMNSQIYTALTKPDTSWICCSCGILSISTSLFESFNINESSNRFDSLTDSTSSFTYFVPVSAYGPGFCSQSDDCRISMRLRYSMRLTDSTSSFYLFCSCI